MEHKHTWHIYEVLAIKEKPKSFYTIGNFKINFIRYVRYSFQSWDYFSLMKKPFIPGLKKIFADGIIFLLKIGSNMFPK